MNAAIGSGLRSKLRQDRSVEVALLEVRSTLASSSWVCAPRADRLPQTLRVTTAGRSACSACSRADQRLDRVRAEPRAGSEEHVVGVDSVARDRPDIRPGLFVNMICLGFELADRRQRLDKAGVR
jgi:hypothetical protein